MIGNSDGPTFKRIEFKHSDFDATRFFSSRRCKGLREIQLYYCDFPESCMRALVSNVRSSLVSIDFSNITHDGSAPPEGLSTAVLLEQCTHLTELSIDSNAARTFRHFGEFSRAPLRSVRLSTNLLSEDIHPFVPALRLVEHLDISLSRKENPENISRLISELPYLATVCISNRDRGKLVIPDHVEFVTRW